MFEVIFSAPWSLARASHPLPAVRRFEAPKSEDEVWRWTQGNHSSKTSGWDLSEWWVKIGRNPQILLVESFRSLQIARFHARFDVYFIEYLGISWNILVWKVWKIVWTVESKAGTIFFGRSYRQLSPRTTRRQVWTCLCPSTSSSFPSQADRNCPGNWRLDIIFDGY